MSAPASAEILPPEQSGRSGPRLIVSIVLLALAVLAGPLFIVGAWAHSQITNTDRYLAAVGPLADEASVQQYVAQQLTTAFEEHVDASSILKTQLPSALQPLSDTMGTALNGFVAAAASRFTASDTFKDVWIDANRLAHNTVSKLLTGDVSAAELQNGELSINIGDALRLLQQRLVADGFTIAGSVDLSNVDSQLVLADGPLVADLENARDLVGVLYDLVWILGIVAIVAAVGSVVIAPIRASALKRLGIGLALAIVVVAIVIAATRRTFVSHAGGAVPDAVVRDTFDALAGSLQFALRLVFVLAVVMAALVAIASLPAYAEKWARPTQVGVSILAAAALLLKSNPTWTYVLVIVVAFVLTEIILELVRRQRLGAEPPAAPVPPMLVVSDN